MRPYVIRQGDYLTKLAHERGFDADEVWNHPDNRELRNQRHERDVLAPGDVLRIPDAPREALAVSVGATNRYRVRVPTVAVHLVVTNGAQPLANERCTIEGLAAARVERTTDANGRLSLDVPLHVRALSLSLLGGAITHSVLVGHLDPITTPTGVRSRLENLGYLATLETEDIETMIAGAVRDFQRDQRLPVTGTWDDDTRAALQRAHGS